MSLRNLLLIALTTLVVISLSACKEDMPDNAPYLMVPNPKDCPKTDPSGPDLCLRLKLVDKANLTYGKDSCAPCSDIDGGFALRPGELEKILAWARSEIKACSASKMQLEEVKKSSELIDNK